MRCSWREPLPVEKVGASLKSPDKLLALAAERYLESEDGAAARKLILDLHPSEALILGARDRSIRSRNSGKSGFAGKSACAKT
jgi:hypothetical protein